MIESRMFKQITDMYMVEVSTVPDFKVTVTNEDGSVRSKCFKALVDEPSKMISDLKNDIERKLKVSCDIVLLNG